MRRSTARGFLVHEISRMRRTFFDQAVKPHGIARAPWWAIADLTRHAEKGMIQSELAKALDTGKVSVDGLIDRLEEAGLVYRKRDAADRRGQVHLHHARRAARASVARGRRALP